MIQQNLLLDPESRAVFELLSRALQQHSHQQGSSSSAAKEPLHQQLHEFGDVSYLLEEHPEGGLCLSFSLPPGMLQDTADAMLGEGTLAFLRSAYAEAAQLVLPPEPGYQVTLALDTRFLTRLSPSLRDHFLKLLASVRLLVTGQPLRQHFLWLASGQAAPGPVEAQSIRPGQVMFVKPRGDSVTVILPLRFLTAQDAAIGHAILQEFAEARRLAALGNAPPCVYSKAPPPELSEVDPGLVSGAGGFISFTLASRHVQGPQQELIVWSLTTFNTLISYHIKACKAMMHTRMRERAGSLITSLRLPCTQPQPLPVSSQAPVLVTVRNKRLASVPQAAPPSRTTSAMVTIPGSSTGQAQMAPPAGYGDAYAGVPEQHMQQGLYTPGQVHSSAPPAPATPVSQGRSHQDHPAHSHRRQQQQFAFEQYGQSQLGQPPMQFTKAQQQQQQQQQGQYHTPEPSARWIHHHSSGKAALFSAITSSAAKASVPTATRGLKDLLPGGDGWRADGSGMQQQQWGQDPDVVEEDDVRSRRRHTDQDIRPAPQLPPQQQQGLW